MPSSDKLASNIIHISYDIVVEVKISGLYKNLIETVPVIIGSIALQNVDLPVWSGIASGGQSLPTLPTTMPMPMPHSSMYPSLPHHLNNSYPQTTENRPSTFSSPTQNQVAEPHRSNANLPSAPPLDFYTVSPNSTRSSICADAPPSYTEVFGSPDHRHSMSINSSMSSLSISQTSYQDGTNSSNSFEPLRTSEQRASVPPRRRRRMAELAQQNCDSINNEPNGNDVTQRFILATDLSDVVEFTNTKKDFCNKVPVATAP